MPERYAAALRLGQDVGFTAAVEPGRTFTARVDFIDPVVQPDTRTIVVKARAPNRDQRHKAGMFIEARNPKESRTDGVWHTGHAPGKIS